MSKVAVTGIGVIAPCGTNKASVALNLAQGRTGIVRYPSKWRSAKPRIAGVVPDFSRENDKLNRDEIVDLDRFAQLGLAAARLAIDDADLAGVDPSDIGVNLATAIGGTPLMERRYAELTDQGATPLPLEIAGGPDLYEAGMFNSLASRIGALVEAENQCICVSTGCTGGLDALGSACDLIEAGEAKVMIAGGAEGPLAEISFAAFDVIGAISKQVDRPAEASRPFDGKRNGFVMGEGAAFFVLEDAEFARKRGARRYAEILGFASRNNTYHMTDLPSDGNALAITIRDALKRAGVSPEQIQYVNAHGSGTPQNDLFETNAYKKVFGARACHVPISSIKSMIGHPLAAAGAIGTASAIMAMNTSLLPPTMNLDHPDPDCDLDYIPNQARQAQAHTSLVTASGFSGLHSALVLQLPGQVGAVA